MSSTLVAMTAVASGLASMGAILAYPLSSRPGRPAMNPLTSLIQRLASYLSRQQALAELASLEDRMLRDIGLTRGHLAAGDCRASARRFMLSEFELAASRRL